jgi:hypothetical protein
MYSASQLDKATTCCLTDCQLMMLLSKKKRILLVLLLVSMSPVTVAVPDKVCFPRAPQVVEAVVESPYNIADDSLHSLLMFHLQSLHEPTNVAGRECQSPAVCGRDSEGSPQGAGTA